MSKRLRCGVEGCRLSPGHTGLHAFGNNIPLSLSELEKRVADSVLSTDEPAPLVAFHVYVEFPAADPWLVWIEAESEDEARETVARDTKDAGGVVRDVRRAP